MIPARNLFNRRFYLTKNLIHTSVKPFPVLQDLFNADCPTLNEAKQNANEQIEKLRKLSALAKNGGNYTF